MQSSRDISRLVEIMAALRTPGSGCAWDLVQTHRSLARYALEEAYEVVDAIERADPHGLCDELGDLLLQVVFHAQVAEEAGVFSFGDVVEGITAKMVRRHPHVFATDGASARPSSDDVAANWEEIKARERRTEGGGAPRNVLAGVPVALPALTRAVKLQNKASSVGFDWNDARLVLAKIREEVDEIEQALGSTNDDDAVAGEIGDMLFAVANLCRHVHVDPESAVRSSNAKFERRFAHIEKRLRDGGTSPEEATLAEMDALWDEAKRAGL